MKNKSIIDSISVAFPCDEDWENMAGGDRKRHCGSCKRDVYNLSAMTRRDARRLLGENKGRICVRYAKLPDGTLRTLDQPLHQITRRSAVAAGVLAATVSLTATAFSQGEPIINRDRETRTSAGAKLSGLSSISFTIQDENEALIQSAKAVLTDLKKRRQFEAISDDDGVARFRDLPFGDYELTVSSPGFRTNKKNIRLCIPQEPHLKISLEVGFVTGILITAWSDVPVFQAIAQGEFEAVKSAFDDGFPISQKDADGNTALHVAVENGKFEMVQFLLVKNAKVNARNAAKLTPIWLVNEIDDEATALEILRLLISKNADVNVRNEDQETLLMLAAEDDDVECVKLLLDAGADPNARDADGETALGRADSPEVKRLLLSFGAKKGSG
ncbi:MAG: ankyrin repeat domain-containing protein [Chloracidobacterium sp.]|nr:ankyrin repeat domain-containing protein [Chloracidobacterium sp.]